MARKPNYGFEKRRKELERKQKQEAKLQRKLDEARDRSDEEKRDAPPDASEPATS